MCTSEGLFNAILGVRRQEIEKETEMQRNERCGEEPVRKGSER